ncbi:gem-associated protein 5-like [Nylanderia fulva]|uniref:gem-associated protein 5-like n=1 Tax=Nylanderia fulva TaxID=613905 RepID=UPI0010FB82A7|nr:gem-associated protein 5-like [Nylanderia fulva]
MNETVLPPSPNWYLSNILVCSKQGTLAWGTKNFIVVARQKEDQSGLQYLLINDAFKSKVTSLAFCPNVDSPNSPELLISGGDDDNVKIWNVDTLELVSKFSFKDGKSIIGVDWSVKDTNLAYAINSEGLLMYCYMSYETSKTICLGKLIPTCLASCPHESNLVAIGTKSGLIHIVQGKTILYKLRGHNEEIVSLSWCPSDMNILNGNDKRDLLLASGAKDRSVFIWRAGRDGRYETVINMPNLPLVNTCHKGKINTTTGTGTGTWIAVCWIEPKVLLTSSLWGELLSWDLSTNNTKPTCKLFHTYHTRGLFCIAAAPKNDTASDNWRTESEFTVWTSAQDRWIIGCKRNSDLTKPAVLEYKIPTQGGFIYCMAACDIDTLRIVFGVGDAILRLWNLSDPDNVKCFDVVSHWQKIKGKIRAVSWFLEDESIVAFGTGEGRIGVFEAIGTNKPPILYKQYHRNTIYKLEWAKLEEDFYLFSCAEGELVAYKKCAPNDEPMSIIKEECTEFAWKSNLCLAIGLENGSIMFYDQMLKKQDTIHMLRSMVNCLAWHPESTATDKWKSPAANYLAVASDCTIVIFDMSELMKDLERALTMDCVEEEDSKEECKRYKTVAMLKGHNNKVVCLAWSPHFSGHLVSGSYDNVAQVWNVEKQELMGTYMGHNGPVLCCMWSPLKPQLIMTGSSDFMLRIWDYTLPTQSPKRISDIKAVKKNLKQQKPPKNWSKIKMNGEQSNTINLTCSQIVKSTNGQSDTYNTKSEIAPSKKKEKNSYFSKYNKLISNKYNILNFIRNDISPKQQQDKDDDNIANISLFSKEDLSKLVDHEKSTQDSNTRTEMNIWCGSLQNDLICAAKNQELNDFLVSLASSISMKMWKEMCEVYAHQLISQGNVEKAVSYLLCIHKIYEALEAFLNANMFKEAYVLARCKLDITDAFLEKILELWSAWCLLNGQMEQAAHCRVELKQYDKAAKILARRKDVHCLEVASQLAFLSGDEGYGISLIVDAMTRALVKSDWSKARSLIASFRQIQYLNVHIDAHEAITSEYKKRTELESMQMWLKESNRVLQTLQIKYSTDNIASYYDALCKNENTNAILKDGTKEIMMKLNASYGIAKAVTCDEEETRLKHLTTVLADIFQHEEMARERGNATDNKFFIHILAILDNRKPTDEDSIYAKTNYPVSQSIRAYLCIGLLDWILNYLDKLLAEEETQFVDLLLNLLGDGINEAAFSHQNRICKLTHLEEQLLNLCLTSNDDDADENDEKKMKEEIDKLKLEENEFREERVCIPKPEVIYDKASSLAWKLSDDNRFRFLHTLEELINVQEINQPELKETLSKKLKNIPQEIDDSLEIQDINGAELKESSSEKLENISQKIEESMEIQSKIEQ